VRETKLMLGVYETFAREHLAIPAITGEKTEAERFPGAVSTYAIEAMVQDKKAIQAGTSHFLGQNFSKAADIGFVGRSGAREFAWTTSWGASTRLIGALIMAHGDDDGVILPPRVAPTHVVILPVIPKPQFEAAVNEACDKLASELRAQRFHGDPIVVEIDRREIGGGTKNWEWIKKGAPIRIEIGPRDLEKGTVAMSRRDRAEKHFVANAEVIATIAQILQSIQDSLLERALKFRKDNTVEINSMDAFREFYAQEQAGFAVVPWAGSAAEEEALKRDLKVTIRCIPDDPALRGAPGAPCIQTGNPAPGRVVFARSY